MTFALSPTFLRLIGKIHIYSDIRRRRVAAHIHNIMGVPNWLRASTINEKVAASAFGRWFRLEGSGHPLERPGSRFLTELRAGTVTAAAMLYVGVFVDELTIDHQCQCVDPV